MAKFIYRGRKKKFNLGKVYSEEIIVNPGETFELTGKDLAVMNQAMTISKSYLEPNPAFQLLDEYEMEKVTEEIEKKKKVKKEKKLKKKDGE